MKRKQLIKKLHLNKAKKMSGLNRFILALLGIGAIVVIIFMGQTLYFSVSQDSVSDYLPANETMAYGEISDLNFPVGQTGGTGDLSQSLGQSFGIELKPALESFATGRLAFALVQDSEGNSYPILFIQTRSRKRALKYFRSMLLEGEELFKSEAEIPVYSFPQGQSFNFALIDRYVVIANGPTALNMLDKTRNETLSTDETYIKSINNLPRRKWMSGYVNLSRISFSNNPAVNNIIEPLKYAIHHLVFTIRKDKQGFLFNTFLNLNKDLLSMKTGENEEKFDYGLTDYIPDKDIALYIGGTNLADEWQNTLETITNLNPAYGIILEGLLRNVTDRIFGRNVDLQNDIYPLFKGEYAIAIGKGDGKGRISLVLAGNDKDFALAKLEKMAEGFKFLAARFSPKIYTIELQDGTQSKELIPDDSKVIGGDESFKGYDIKCIQVTGTSAGFCYSVTDDFIMITNDKQYLKDTIDPSKGLGMLSENNSFRKTVGNLSKVNNEVTFVNFNNLQNLLSANKYVQAISPILERLESASWVKHYFDDGVSTEGYILVK